MRKTMATLFAIGLLWIGYTAWPIYDLLVLVRAIETRDADTAMRHVYFDAVRRSLTDQIVAAYVRRSGMRISPFAQHMAAGALGIADPVVNKLVSPEALSEMLAAGWPVAAVREPPPPGTLGITMRTVGTIWQIFSEFGIRHRQVRSVGAGRAAAGAALWSYVPAAAVALATGRRHPPGEHSGPAR